MKPGAVQEVGRVKHGGSEDAGLIDFSANVSPRIPEGVSEVYENALEKSRRYPQDPPYGFGDSVSEYLDCPPENVVPTPGGLAALRLAIETNVADGDHVLVPAPSFSEYGREVRLQGAVPDYVPHDRILDLNPSGYSLAIICNPNNPTGEIYDRERLLGFARDCRRSNTTLLVDEAFLGFTREESLAGTAGVIVARSLTKIFGLPGIRMGFCVSSGDLLDRLLKARRTWNVGRPAVEVAKYCLGKDDFVAETRNRVESERRRMRKVLSKCYGVHPSQSPFFLLNVGSRSVADLVSEARRRGVAVRDATSFRRLGSHVRVAVRLTRENDRLLEVPTDV
ncbi:MAG: threonine-phosphate decarboxylase [Halobacteria archaeon]